MDAEETRIIQTQDFIYKFLQKRADPSEAICILVNIQLAIIFSLTDSKEEFEVECK